MRRTDVQHVSVRGTPLTTTSTIRRKATYPAARRIARMVHELPSHPHGWSFDAIQQQLSIGERTLLRYVEACRGELVDAHGEPLLEVVQRGPRRMLRLKDAGSHPDPAALSAVSTFFTLATVRFLEGTILKESVDALWEKLLERVPAAARPQLANLDRKFWAISFVPGDYADHSATIDEIIQALVREYRLTIDYAGVLGEGREHDFEPYTLLSHRGGLFLVGRSLALDRIIWLAVERIRGLKPTQGDGARGRARFTYPRNFHPERHADGMFGMGDGPETEVELAIANAQTEAHLRTRTVHPSQKFVTGADGRTWLTMTVRGTVELANWIMSLTPWIEVMRPSELREEVARRLAEASSRYATPREAVASRG